MQLKEALDFINKEQKEIILLGYASAVLDWDRKIDMPEKGLQSRAEQISTIHQLIYMKVSSNKLYNYVKFLKRDENIKKLDSKEKLIVSKLYKDISKARKLPGSFIQEMSETITKATAAWEKAKEKGDFNIFKPHLEKIVYLRRREAKYIKLPGHPYNSLLDSYEEGMTVEKLIPVFAKLKEELIALLEDIKKSKIYNKHQRLPKGNWPVESQKRICNAVIERMGIDRKHSRTEEYTHPFTATLGVGDVRITNQFRPDEPLYSFFAGIHEGGHALYELGFPKSYAETILHDAPSIGLHESQSKFWEENIGKSKDFLKKNFLLFKKEFKDKLLDFDFKDFYMAVNEVKPTHCRVSADEVTYCLHIILRFELEMDLISGKLDVKNLPKEWNKKSKELLGIIPKTDNEGVLQDCHWSFGDFGYFPTYAIGCMYATQIYNKLVKDNRGIKKEISKGNYKPILKWLRTKIHKHGSSKKADDIIKSCCGKGLNSDDLIQYLRDKYSKIYGFKN